MATQKPKRTRGGGADFVFLRSRACRPWIKVKQKSKERCADEAG